MDERVSKIVEVFDNFDSWENRYKHLISMGKELSPMDEAHKVENNKVKGCQSQVWLHAQMNDELIHFSADSDAAIVKGIIALLLEIYSERTIEEIQSIDATFVEKIGLKQHLSMSRANGLSAMMKQIQFYAMAFEAKKQMGQIIKNNQ